jgi:large subunit ribosomal protein L30
MSKKLQVTLIKSSIGFEQSQKDTVRSLGLRRIRQTVVHNDTPQVRGMIAKVIHMLKVEEIEA